jgi:mannan endo-1,4-beta-mannosidase
MTANGTDDTTEAGEESTTDRATDRSTTDQPAGSSTRTTNRRRLLQGIAGVGAITYDGSSIGEVDAATASAPDTFVQRDGAELSVNGSRWFFSGANSYQLTDPHSSTEKVDRIFERADELDLDVLRTWAFCTGQEGRCFQPWAWHHDETALKRLDYVVKKAREYDLRLILALAGNWDHYGGMHKYVEWTSASSHDDFYTNQECRNIYKNHVQTILNRWNTFTDVQYKNDPAIMVWELANEPRAKSDPSGDTLETWFRDLSQFVKSIDGNHLVSTGMEGFWGDGEGWKYDGSQGTYYVRHHEIDTIDIATFHMYPQHWVDGQERQRKWAFWWLKNHIRSAHNLDKPVYIGEFSWVDSDRGSVYRNWYDVLDKEDADGALIWNLSTNQSDSNSPYSVDPAYDPDVAQAVQSYSNRISEKRENGGSGGGGDGGRYEPAPGDPLPLRDDVYQLINVNSGKALEVAGPRFYDGANVRQWEDFDTGNQHWYVEHVRDGLYKLQSIRTGKVLDVQWASEQNGMNVYQWNWHDGPNQLWRIEHLGDGEYRLLAANSGKALEVSDYSTSDGGNVRQWYWHGDANQRWFIEPKGGSRTHSLNAEYHERDGTTTDTSRSGFWGNAYVTDFTNGGDSVTVEFNSAYSGERSIRVRYAAPHGDKQCDLYVNGSQVNSPMLWWSEPFRQTWVGDYWFQKGTNTITIEQGWGHYDIDCIIVEE